MQHITRLALVAATAALFFWAPPAHAGRDMKLEEVPTAARQTIERELRGATPTSVEQDSEDGKTVYEVEFTKDGQRWELDVAPDGTLLERHRD